LVINHFTTMNLDKEQIKQAKGRLSEKVVEILDSEETAVLLAEIGKKHQLHIDQTGNLAKIVRLFIMGLVKANDFGDILTKETGISTDLTNLIIYELNQKLFSKIRIAMREASTAKPENVETESPEKDMVDQEGASEDVPTPDTFSQKMTAEYGLSREKVEISDQPNQSEPPQPNNTPPRHDPYREPLP